MKPIRPHLTHLTAALLLLSSLRAHAGDWYRWRGPEQNGTSRETNLPEKWDTGGPDSNLAWTAPYGGMSSPIVMNGKLYTLSRIGDVEQGGNLVVGPKTQETVVCLDINTGKPVWTHAMNMTQTEVPFHRIGWSNPCGDPATGRVYVFGSQCNLISFDGATGKVEWQRQMTEEFGVISTFGGRTASPAVDEDQVFLCAVAFGWGDNARAQYRLFAFNKLTGQLNWTTGTGAPPVDSPYQTPTITVVNGEKQLIVGSGDGGIYGFQPRTGKKIWGQKVSKRGLNSSVLVDGALVYCSTSEVNADNAFSGTVRCYDITGNKPKEVWRRDGVEAGFASPTLANGTLYVLDDAAMLYAMDAKTGKDRWKKRCGTIGKASLVYADGKLYLPEGNGRMFILKPGDKKVETLSKVEITDKLGREYGIFGSVAISNGRVYLQAANALYAIGPKEIKVSQEKIPPLPAESKDGDKTPTVVQVRPADISLHPGQTQQFTLDYFDALGRPTAVEPTAKPEWSVGQLTFQPPAKTLADPLPPTIKIGNLKGAVDANGLYTAEKGPPQGGGVYVTVGKLTGFGRVRVFPPLPWKYDFEQTPVGVPPLTWLGAGGKFSTVEFEKGKSLCKVPQVDLYYRARTNFGTPDMANYTLQADVQSAKKIIAGPGGGAPQLMIPDPGIINQRYVMQLYGNGQFLELHAWAGAIPNGPAGGAGLSKRVAFAWQPDKWYTMKLRVDQLADKAAIHGKVWPVGDKEPDAWTIELEDTLPNRSGNPGLFGHSLVTPFKSEIYYDNIQVTDNK